MGTRKDNVSKKQPEQSHRTNDPTSTTPANPGPSSTSGKQFNLSEFEQDCLDEHNRLRALHGCPPLTLCRELCAYSTKWAKTLAKKNALEHRQENKYGENLFMSGGMEVNGKLPVKMWYDEIAKYDFSKPGFKQGVGHFTQLIWKASQKMGVGVERRGDKVWVVSNYDPPGNFLNEFEANVPRPSK